MIYCINCGAKNDNFVKNCVRCKHSFASRKVTYKTFNEEGFPATYSLPMSKYTVTNYGEEIITSSWRGSEDRPFSEDIMPEPFTPEEIESIQVANANQPVKLSFPKQIEKKTSRKRKKD